MIAVRAAAVLFVMLLAACAQSPSQSSQDLVVEEFMVPGADPGVQLYLRNKRPRDLAAFTPENIVLFVHGATYPAETAFDLRLDGLSWMDYIAARGYDVWLVDIRGYGKSSRPPEMDQPAAANKPVVNTQTAANDYAAAASFIRAKRAIPRLTALAWLAMIEKASGNLPMERPARK